VELKVGMGRYSLRFIVNDSATAEILEFECASDQEAINSALDRAKGRAFELQCGDRKILSTSAKARRASPIATRKIPGPGDYSNW
jgi:hypothetical protein